MTLSRNAHHMGISGWQATRKGFEMLLIQFRLLILLNTLHVTILGHTKHKVIAQLLTRLPKCVDIAAALSHVDPLVVFRDPSDLLDTVLPDLRFARALFPLDLRFPNRCELADKGFLSDAPQDLLGLRIHRQNRVQAETDIRFPVAHRSPPAFRAWCRRAHQTRSCLPTTTSAGIGPLRHTPGSSGGVTRPHSERQRHSANDTPPAFLPNFLAHEAARLMG